MKEQLWYLLDELDNWEDDKVITVEDLKRMINKAFDQEASDKKQLDTDLQEF